MMFGRGPGPWWRAGHHTSLLVTGLLLQLRLSAQHFSFCLVSQPRIRSSSQGARRACGHAQAAQAVLAAFLHWDKTSMTKGTYKRNHLIWGSQFRRLEFMIITGGSMAADRQA